MEGVGVYKDYTFVGVTRVSYYYRSVINLSLHLVLLFFSIEGDL